MNFLRTLFNPVHLNRTMKPRETKDEFRNEYEILAQSSDTKSMFNNQWHFSTPYLETIITDKIFTITTKSISL